MIQAVQAYCVVRTSAIFTCASLTTCGQVIMQTVGLYRYETQRVSNGTLSVYHTDHPA